VFGLRALAWQQHLQPSKRHGPNSEHTAIGDPIVRRCGVKKAAYLPRPVVTAIGETRRRALTPVFRLLPHLQICVSIYNI
jgi:hypothetical protein